MTTHAKTSQSTSHSQLDPLRGFIRFNSNTISSYIRTFLIFCIHALISHTITIHIHLFKVVHGNFRNFIACKKKITSFQNQMKGNYFSFMLFILSFLKK